MNDEFKNLVMTLLFLLFLTIFAIDIGSNNNYSGSANGIKNHLFVH